MGRDEPHHCFTAQTMLIGVIWVYFLKIYLLLLICRHSYKDRKTDIRKSQTYIPKFKSIVKSQRFPVKRSTLSVVFNCVAHVYLSGTITEQFDILIN